MKRCSFLQHPFLCLLVLPMLVAPVFGATVNQKPIANAGADQTVGFLMPVALDGRGSHDADGTIKKYQWTQIGGTKVTLARPSTARAAFRSPARLNNQESVTLVFSLSITDDQYAVASDTVTVTVQKFGNLNDTGITTCSDETKNDLACPVTGYPGQDAEVGRDVTYNNDLDGHNGFSFTKISSTGNALPANATNWNCVQDNVTGLMWENKTDDGGLHDKDWSYSWYEPDNSKNGGGYAGRQNHGSCGNTSGCDTYAYVNAVNAVGWCGFKDWRIPTVDELSGLGGDPVFFQNAPLPTSWIWSSTPSAGNNIGVWIARLNGDIYGNPKNTNYNYQVLLVRGRS